MGRTPGSMNKLMKWEFRLHDPSKNIVFKQQFASIRDMAESTELSPYFTQYSLSQYVTQKAKLPAFVDIVRLENVDTKGLYSKRVEKHRRLTVAAPC